MRNTRWLRASLASLTVCGLALSAFVVACGDDDTGGGGVTPGTDSGTDTGAKTDSGGTDSGGSDSGSDSGPKDGGGDADAGPPAAKLQLINGATDLGPNDPVGALRICYKIGQTEGALIWAPLPPLPNRKVAGSAQPFPGLFAGTGGPVDGTGTHLDKLIIKPYLFSALSLEKHGLGSTVTPNTEKSCEAIVDADAGGGAGPLEENKDYWVLPNIPAQTFLDANSYLLVLTGCAGGSTATAAACGGNPGASPGLGNLAINIYKIDNVTKVDADKLGLQFVNSSPNLEGFLQTQSGGTLHTRPSIQSDPAVPSTAKLFGSVDGGTPGDVPEKQLTTIVQLTAVNNQTDNVMANPNVADIKFSIPQVAQLSFGVADGGFYANGQSFTVVAVGDLTAPKTVDAGDGLPPAFNTKFFHFLALPNDPATKVFDPEK